VPLRLLKAESYARPKNCNCGVVPYDPCSWRLRRGVAIMKWQLELLRLVGAMLKRTAAAFLGIALLSLQLVEVKATKSKLQQR
jgi:hypothetical protein